MTPVGPFPLSLFAFPASHRFSCPEDGCWHDRAPRDDTVALCSRVSPIWTRDLRPLDRVPRDGTLGALVQRGEVLHVARVELEVEQVGVRLDAAGRVGLGQGHCARGCVRRETSQSSGEHETTPRNREEGEGAPGRTETLLEGPPDEDLRHRDVVFLGELLQRRVVEALAAEDGAVRLDDDPFLLAVLDDRLLLQERVQFDLVHFGRLEAGFLDLL